MTDAETKLARIQSDLYRHEFFGILNVDGDFWTPLAFDSEKAARDHITWFWRKDEDSFNSFLADHKIVPVRITLEQLPDTLLTEGEGK